MINTHRLLFIIFLILALIFLGGSAEQRVTKAHFIGKTLLLPYVGSITYLSSIQNLVEKNDQIISDLFQIQAENNQLKDQLHLYQRVDSLLHRDYVKGFSLIVARVVGTGSFLNYETLTIDQGVRDGIKTNQPVISSNGVVGKTLAVYPHYTVVQTFGDRYFRMGAINERSRVQGIIETDFDSKIFLKNIAVGSDIKIGDPVITSKLSDIYPPELPFGYITNIEQTSDGLFMQAEIKPLVNLSQIEEVGIININE